MIISRTYRNFGLEIARATAACLVLTVHLVGNFLRIEMGTAWYLACLGVDIFFVLSGFLIGNILLQSIDPGTGQFSFGQLKRFYIRRWLRTVPLYYFVLLVNVAAGYFIFRNTGGFSFRFLFWTHNFTGRPPAFFGESWSLAVEEWFYFVYPLGMILFLRICKNLYSYPKVLLAYTLLFLLAGNMLRLTQLGDTYHEYNILVCRIDAIAYGVLLAVLDKFFLARFFRRKFRLCGAAGLALVVAGVYIFLVKDARIPYLLYYPLVGTGIAGLLVFMKQARFAMAGPFRRLVSRISNLSYSIYLNNLVIIYLVMRLLPAHPLVQLLVALVLVLLVSQFTYKAVELRFIGFRDAYFPGRRGRSGQPAGRFRRQEKAMQDPEI